MPAKHSWRYSSLGSLNTDWWCMWRQVLAPGLRIGWVTAAPKLVEKIIYHMQGIHLGANSFTQASACHLDKEWCHVQWQAHKVPCRQAEDFRSTSRFLESKLLTCGG